MPKTPVDKYTGLQFGQYNVGFSGQVFTVKTEAKAISMKKFPNNHFGASVFPFDFTHHPRACCFVYDIHHITPYVEPPYE